MHHLRELRQTSHWVPEFWHFHLKSAQSQKYLNLSTSKSQFFNVSIKIFSWPPPLNCHNCLNCRMAVEVLNCHNCLQLPYGSWWTQLLYGSCHNCRMAVATTAVWQLSQLPYGSCHNCHMAVATTAVWQLPQTVTCRSQLPKLPEQQLVVIPLMLRRTIFLKFALSNKKIRIIPNSTPPPPFFS